ncbi:response regulator transcription factor [Labilibacter marinus]|uniref:response regulator transcription factor n=1 Tax=Labilibacter marinus TaxID=1477105 RepID=UPI00094FC78A|nr:response regulator transcription factor [Labilibacter marinus]
MSNAKLFLVDDHLIFREGLKNLIEIEGIGTVVGESSNGKDFLENFEKSSPDLILMDISMPIMDGIEATKKAIKVMPDLKIMALSMNGDEEYYYKMIEAGVKGFLLKDSGIREIEKGIKAVLDGDSYFSNELLRRIITNLGKPVEKKTGEKELLSSREHEVLVEICNGLTNEEIATKLFISAQTVKGHRSSLLSKTNCKNSASLVMYAIKNKLVEI